ncbi:hypothetical protein BHM03_00001275 [Ensete ventricosum]|nr:hypothetical protein BHM03_00001275 [Ensete ventricosum]
MTLVRDALWVLVSKKRRLTVLPHLLLPDLRSRLFCDRASIMVGSNEQREMQRVAVITGANKGIGLEIARQLALHGVTVVLTARDEKRGAGAAESLRGSHQFPNVVFHQLDVRDETSVGALAEFVRTQFGKLDILVEAKPSACMLESISLDTATAGEQCRGVRDGVMRQTYDGAVTCFETNYYGCKRVTEALLPLLELSTSGARIVNVSSLRSELRVKASFLTPLFLVAMKSRTN